MKKKIFIIVSLFLVIFTLASCNNKPVDKLESKEVNKYVLQEQEACFRFFWETQNVTEDSKAYGLIPDRFPNNGLASIASVGFGLAGFCVGVQNDWITEEEARQRAVDTLRAIDELATIEGYYYHFYTYRTGAPASGSEISNIDTAILIAGALMAGEYFGGEVKKLANKIYDEVNWPWYINPDTNQFYMGYDPEKKEFSGAWDFYGEQLMMYFLAAGSKTHPIEKKVYDKFTKHLGVYQGGNGEAYMFYHSWFGSIFTYQFSHAFVDFRNIVDANGIDWYENSVKATKAARQYCIDNPEGFVAFGPNAWGLTACDTPTGYSGLLGNPPSGYSNDSHKNDGTIATAGSIGSMPFLPKEVTDSVVNYYTLLDGKLVGKYGLYDSFNLEHNRVWIGKDVIGIDKGISLLMIENYRSELIWKYFMQADFMDQAIEVLGFEEA